MRIFITGAHRVLKLRMQYLYLPLLIGCVSAGPPSRISLSADTAPQLVSVTISSIPQSECRPILKKSVVNGLFLIPINPVNSGDLGVKATDSPRYVRFRRIIQPQDVLFTLLGFMFSIVVHTQVVEDCGAVDPMLWADRERGLLNRLSSLGIPVHLVYLSSEGDRNSSPQVTAVRILYRSVKLDVENTKGIVAVDGDSLSFTDGDLVVIKKDGTGQRVLASEVLAVHLLMPVPSSVTPPSSESRSRRTPDQSPH